MDTDPQRDQTPPSWRQFPAHVRQLHGCQKHVSICRGVLHSVVGDVHFWRVGVRRPRQRSAVFVSSGDHFLKHRRNSELGCVPYHSAKIDSPEAKSEAAEDKGTRYRNVNDCVIQHIFSVM